MTALPKPVVDAMADRSMRLHHLLWHAARNGWAGMTPAEQQIFRDHGWEPPRPGLTAAGDPEMDNGSGEDFLYMHREMIADVDDILARLGDPQYPRVEGWPAVPAPDDPDYPVPPDFDIPGAPGLTGAIRNAKTDASLDQLRAWEATSTDPAVLRQVTLGQLGAFLEYGIHNRMHLRWSAEMPAYRPNEDPFTIGAQWDDARYNWLADPYSAHVNPAFWKLHGWVDARIDDWMAANDLTGPVPWSFDPPWSGPMEHGEHDHHPVAGPSLRAHALDAETFELVEPQLRAMEATVRDLRRAGVPEPPPLPVVTGLTLG
ncbi:hypothetical protein ACFPM3_06285 [Streptomyces coeruleoprunus]|uniref:Uncharacterized protein n=1 Tax=Streptomyces coeruleoprunus TaxID=285563 RepID=A0ABV9XDU4_9ACTN